MNKLSVRDLPVSGKRVLVRVDYNVPLSEDGQTVSNGLRIDRSLPTLRYLLEAGASPILMSHLGRPKGEVVPSMSLRPVALELERRLSAPVVFATDCVGDPASSAVSSCPSGGVVLLENLRYHKAETENDVDFARSLAILADVYVNDAFGTVHRAHASVDAVPRLFFGRAAAGLLVEKEIEYLGGAVSNPEHPFVAILGGAKVADKIPVMKNLVDKVDVFLVGGGMAYTFLKVSGVDVGGSKLEPESMELAGEILGAAKALGKLILLPEDHVIADAFSADAEVRTVVGDIPTGWMALDIGPATTKRYVEALSSAKLVIWNGPLGVFEMEPFASGTRTVAEAVARGEATSIVGGGDSAAAAEKFGLSDGFSHVSTGGGASLEMLGGSLLPGLDALSDPG